MNLTAVISLLERRIGLDPASLGSSAFAVAVGDRMRLLALTDPDVYADRLTDSAKEFDALVDRLVVPETWFFRGTGLFDVLGRHIATALQTSSASRPFRILSLPCGSGEEPYSLAIALLEAGLPSGRWAIDAIDLSPRLIDVARRGLYSGLSFRQTDPGLRDRHFRPVTGGWELSPAVRELVRFRAGNLVDAALLPDESGVYDLILCRNLLIYLTPAARQRGLDTLERLLAPGGLLSVGHAEPQMLAGREFTRFGAEQHFLFRQGRGLTVVQASRVPEPEVVWKPPPRPSAPPGANATGLAVPPVENTLARARLLADAGRLDDALAECRSHLGQTGPSADAYSLLGVIQQARGDREAATDAFRRALYLDPNHREALTHAMLLAAQRGDTGRAAALRERLARTGGEP
ncbi:MAG TPA: CheR family methyltransferase [Gemmataceae bacterium]|nr:CheR family methyltransferase [Gemmataceae bacterium]